MIAVDTNILIHLWLPTDQTKLVEQVFNKDQNWIAPYFWRSEFRNVVWQYMKLGLPFEQAMESIFNAETLMMGNEFDVISIDVVELARTSGCTAYDCEFIYVAQSKIVPLITFDKELLRKFPRIAINPTRFLQT